MTQKVFQIGGYSYAIVIPKEYVKKLHITKKSLIEIDWNTLLKKGSQHVTHTPTSKREYTFSGIQKK